jgi:cysteine desulfurase / selenocysteine lyase
VFDPIAIRKLFPVLDRKVDGKPLIYLDNGATTQKPQQVIDAVGRFYAEHNANIHRAVHRLSEVSTELFESARLKVSRFLNSPSAKQVIFTRGTTESINLVAHSFGELISAGSEIVLSTFEHHSNIVPWQMLAARRGVSLRVIPITDAGELDYNAAESIINPKTALVAITHTSNALGTNIDVGRVVAMARRAGAKVLVDGAQRVGHEPVDVRQLDVDFYVFSGHKLFAPTGVGVLWGRLDLLEKMPPWQGGGDMIRTVSFDKTTYADLPNKFEAGTPDIAGVVGLGAAIDFLSSLDRAAMLAHEHDLLAYATDRLGSLPGIRLVGTAADKACVISFVMTEPAVDHHTLGSMLNLEGVAVRTGHHCCMPLMDRLGLSGTVRASFAFYNTRNDVDRLVDALNKVRSSFQSVSPAPVARSNDVLFATALAPSPDEASAMFVDDFNLFDDWEQKHEYLLDLGKKIAPLPVHAKVDRNKVQGCQSTVHLVGRAAPGRPGVVEFAAESDAFIVNGLIALLLGVYSGQSAKDVLRFQVEPFFDRLGLTHHLSMGRRNGLAGMVSRVRLIAAGMVDADELRQLTGSNR